MKKLIFILLIIAIIFTACAEPDSDPDPDPMPDPTPEPTYNETIFYDDISNGIKEWVADPTVGTSRWYIVAGYSHTIAHSWSGYNREYDHEMNLTSKSFDLTNYGSDILLTFWTAYNIEEEYDFGYVEYSIDSGASWVKLLTITGEQSYWDKEELLIEGVGGEVDFKIRFAYITDGTILSLYWYVDDIKLSGNKE